MGRATKGRCLGSIRASFSSDRTHFILAVFLEHVDIALQNILGVIFTATRVSVDDVSLAFQLCLHFESLCAEMVGHDGPFPSVLAEKMVPARAGTCAGDHLHVQRQAPTLHPWQCTHRRQVGVARCAHCRSLRVPPRILWNSCRIPAVSTGPGDPTVECFRRCGTYAVSIGMKERSIE